MGEVTKYNYMENFLQDINRKYISLSDADVAVNNRVLLAILDTIISEMKNIDPLFKSLYKSTFSGGSYFDGLKVGKPEEFDLDLLLVIPKYCKPVVTKSNLAGYVHVQLEDFKKFEKQPEAIKYPKFANLLSSDLYLETKKVSSWIEGIIAKALLKFEKNGASESIIKTTQGTLTAKTHKGGPAHTLKLKGLINNKAITMDVDLVPCFIFTKELWPAKPYRNSTISKDNKVCSDFFVVPKTPSKTVQMEKYWRLSLQEQERLLMNGYLNLKPTIRLLKKLRDTLDHKMIASYYIKTVFLWELETNKTLWKNSLSYVFMTMLEKYQKCLEQKKIPYYWNKENNLINFKASSLENMSNKIKRIIDDVKRNPTDEKILAKYLLSPQENIEFTSMQFQKLKIIG